MGERKFQFQLQSPPPPNWGGDNRDLTTNKRQKTKMPNIQSGNLVCNTWERRQQPVEKSTNTVWGVTCLNGTVSLKMLDKNCFLVKDKW